jgi:hypothetical protein
MNHQVVFVYFIPMLETFQQWDAGTLPNLPSEFIAPLRPAAHVSAAASPSPPEMFTGKQTGSSMKFGKLDVTHPDKNYQLRSVVI